MAGQVYDIPSLSVPAYLTDGSRERADAARLRESRGGRRPLAPTLNKGDRRAANGGPAPVFSLDPAGGQAPAGTASPNGSGAQIGSPAGTQTSFSPDRALTPAQAEALGLTVPAASNAPASPGLPGNRGRTVAVISVDDLRRGINVGLGGSGSGNDIGASPQNPHGGLDPRSVQGQLDPRGAPIPPDGQSHETSASPSGEDAPVPLRLRGSVAPSSGLAGGDLAGAGTFGRRYRPLDNGRLANTGERVKNLSEEQKIAKLADLKKSAEEYEGMLMAEMIKSMRQSAFVKTPGGDTYSEIAEKPFTAAITAAGGLGLSETIVSQVAAQEGLDDILAAHPEAMGPNWRQRLSPSQMPKPGPRPAGRVGEAKPAGSAPEGARTAGRDQASQAGLASQTSQTSQATQAGQTAPGDNPEGAGS